LGNYPKLNLQAIIRIDKSCLMRKRLNILQLIPDFGQGGAEKVFSQLGHELSKRYMVIDGVFNQALKQHYKTRNQIVELGVSDSENFIIKMYNFFLRILRLKKLKNRLYIDVTISHLEGADYVNVLSKGRDKTILCIHGSKDYDQNISGPIGWLRKKLLMPTLYNRADHLVAVSLGIKSELVNRFKVKSSRISVIPNFFDLKVLREKAESKLSDNYSRLLKGYDILIASGRLEAQKNHRLLISLMPAILKQKQSVKLILLGEGTLYTTLIQQTELLGLRVQTMDKPLDETNHIFFLGYQENPFSIIKHAKVFVMPSLWEGFPLSLCEAMAVGTPVIAHDCPTGPREIICPAMNEDFKLSEPYFSDYGTLIPVNISDDLSKKYWVDVILMHLKDDQHCLEIAKGAKSRVQEFDKQFIMSQWYSLIEQVINK
jgi:glycosyltransferase involved in cell wall biosynthesis